MGTRSRICPKGWMVWGCMEGLCYYQTMPKLIIDKSIVQFSYVEL